MWFGQDPMASPEDQAALDAEQSEQILTTQENLAKFAQFMRMQGNFVPESIAAMPGVKGKAPPPSECPLYGTNGYREFPFGGGWYSFRAPELAGHRKMLMAHYGVDEKEFYWRRVNDEIVVVPYGDAQGEESAESSE